MLHKGQVVEIPRDSVLYTSAEEKTYSSKKEELLSLSEPLKYTLFDGILIEGHHGIENFKLFQRKGITKGGYPLPLYVIAIDPKESRIFVGAGNDHPALFTKVLRLKKDQLQESENLSKLKFPIEGFTKLQQKNELYPSVLYHFDDSFFLEFTPKIKQLDKEQTLTFISKDNTTTKIIFNNYN